MSAGVFDASLRWERGVFTILRRELAPSPARWRASLRLGLSTVIAIALMQILHVPQGEFVLVTLFVVTQTDAWASVSKAALRVIGTVIGGLIGIVGIITFSDQPWFLFVLQALMVGVALFFSRTTTAPYAFVIFGMTYLIVAPDYVTTPDYKLETALWRMGLVAAGSAFGTLIQLVLWPDHPEDLLLEDLALRLRKVETALDRFTGASHPPVFAADPVAAIGIARQLDLLASAESMSRWLRQRHPEQMNLIVDMQRVVSATIRLEHARVDPASLPPHAKARFAAMRDECARLRGAILAHHSVSALPETQDPLTLDGELATPQLELLAAAEEIEIALARMAPMLAFLDHPRSPTPTREPLALRTIFNPDCKPTNVEVMRFALKGMLGASLCALIYAGLNWPQISTCVLTCLVVAQTTIGAGRRRMQLRFIGAVLGGLAALVGIVILMPNMTSLASLMVVSAVLFGAAAWIVTGSSHIAYAGMQMAIALSLVMINGTSPTTDLDPWRDRMFGVVLGIVVMGAVDVGIWPVFARDAIRNKIATALETMASLQRQSVAGDDPALRRSALAIYRSLSDALAQEDELLAEPEWNEEQAAKRRLGMRLTSALQDLFLAQLGMHRHRPAIAAASPSAAVVSGLQALEADLMQRMTTLAAGLRTGHVDLTVPPPDPSAVDALAASSSDPELQEAVVVYRRLIACMPRLRQSTAEAVAA